MKMSLEQSNDIKLTEHKNAKGQAYKVPSNKTLAWRFGLELLSIAVVLILVLIPYVLHGSRVASVQKRGFFCDDVDIKHPYKEETIRFEILLLRL